MRTVGPKIPKFIAHEKKEHIATLEIFWNRWAVPQDAMRHWHACMGGALAPVTPPFRAPLPRTPSTHRTFQGGGVEESERAAA